MENEFAFYCNAQMRKAIPRRLGTVLRRCAIVSDVAAYLTSDKVRDRVLELRLTVG
jgi:hypothetical protein